MSDELRNQINDIIEGEIQNGINDYLEEKQEREKDQGMGFITSEEAKELKVKVFKDEERNTQFPLDAYIVTYKDSNGDVRKDIVRASAKVNLFDMYYDKFGANSLISMDYGYGTVNPKLYGIKVPNKTKKRPRRNA